MSINAQLRAERAAIACDLGKLKKSAPALQKNLAGLLSAQTARALSRAEQAQRRDWANAAPHSTISAAIADRASALSGLT